MGERGLKGRTGAGEGGHGSEAGRKRRGRGWDKG